jgi:hypothetical protein
MDIVNIRNKSKVHSLYIGRFCSKGGWDLQSSKWQNKFVISQQNSRENCISNYEQELVNGKLYNSLYELLGHVLGCWCKPEACHGDILVKYCNKVIYNVLIENNYCGCNLSQLSGIRSAELYLSLLEVNSNIIAPLAYPRIEKVRRDDTILISFPDISNFTLYLSVESNPRCQIQILANNLEDYSGGFLCCLSVYGIRVPPLWKCLYNCLPSIPESELLSSSRIY